MKNFVGFYKGCNAPVPQSGVYLTQLPGIEFASEEAIADADEVTALGLWDNLQATAIQTFRDDILEQFGYRYMIRQITQTVDLGQAIDNTVLTAPVANVTNGIIMETIDQGANVACSNLMQLYVQSVSFYWQGTNPTPSFTLTFQDADLLNTELTIAVTNAVAGWNTVWVDQKFNARRLYMLASGNFDDYVQLDISEFNLDNFGMPWGRGATGWLTFSWNGMGCQTRVNGVSYNSASNQAQKAPNTYGMSCVFSTKCNWDTIVCANKRHFTNAWLYCLAIEFLNYRLNTSRQNRFTTTDLGQAEKLRDMFVLKYRGGTDSGTDVRKVKLQYPGLLHTACDSISMNDYDCCLKVNSYIISKELLP